MKFEEPIKKEHEGETSTNQEEEKDPRLEREESLILKYQQIIREVIIPEFLKLGNINEGEKDGVSWRQTFKSGKQSPVAILEFTFPEGDIFEVVFKTTSQEFADICEKYPIVKKHFPSVYLKEEVDEKLGYGEKKDILVIERIKGYEEKLDKENEFENYITDPEKMEQLCKEIFDIVIEIYKEPLHLQDVNPVRGHNVFFNTKTGHFQLFDVDTISNSEKSLEEKFMDFINRGQRCELKDVAFIVRMIQLYKERYLDAELEYQEEREYTLVKFELVDPDLKEEGLIYFGDAEYEDTYRYIDWRGTMGRKDLPPIKKVTRKGKDRFSLNRDLLIASQENDIEKAMEAVKKCNGNIVEREFIEKS